MLTAALLLLGVALLALTLADSTVKRLPLSPAVIYLLLGWFGGALLGTPELQLIENNAKALSIVTEVAVLASLFAVGLRLRVPPTWRAWSGALLLAGPAMVVAVLLGAVAAFWVMDLPWAPALLLAAILAPTDPVLASEVQIRNDDDRDKVRLSITAEGGLNDGTALPAVMLALGLMGLHPHFDGGPALLLSQPAWWWSDLLWPIGGGLLLGGGVGWLLGHALRKRFDRGDTLARDELLYAAAVALAYGLARATQTSAFVVVFALGAMLLWPLRGDIEQSAEALARRMQSFGARGERLVEAASVLAVGIALHAVAIAWTTVAFGLLLVGVVRPLSVLAVIRLTAMTRRQRLLVAWFGIRGIGSLFYLMFALEHGVAGALAAELTGAVLIAIALSIVLHGVSATPLMSAYHRRRPRPPALPPAP